MTYIYHSVTYTSQSTFETRMHNYNMYIMHLYGLDFSLDATILRDKVLRTELLFNKKV